MTDTILVILGIYALGGTLTCILRGWVTANLRVPTHLDPLEGALVFAMWPLLLPMTLVAVGMVIARREKL